MNTQTEAIVKWLDDNYNITARDDRSDTYLKSVHITIGERGGFGIYLANDTVNITWLNPHHDWQHASFSYSDPELYTKIAKVLKEPRLEYP